MPQTKSKCNTGSKSGAEQGSPEADNEKMGGTGPEAKRVWGIVGEGHPLVKRSEPKAGAPSFNWYPQAAQRLWRWQCDRTEFRGQAAGLNLPVLSHFRGGFPLLSVVCRDGLAAAFPGREGKQMAGCALLVMPVAGLRHWHVSCLLIYGRGRE
jgi:hypothetical protein